MSLENVVVPTSTDTSSSVERFSGCVKWFNNKSGYGFITDTQGNDVFVHHTAINVSSQQYKYLVQGEYVEFVLIKTEGGKHEFQAGDVCGIKNGKLMCETRREIKMSRTTYKSDSDLPNVNSDAKVFMPKLSRQTNAPRIRGDGPREVVESDTNQKGFTLVQRGNKVDKNVDGRNVENKARRGRPPRVTNV